MFTWMPRFGASDCTAPKSSLLDTLTAPDKTLLKKLRTSSLIVGDDVAAGALMQLMFSEGSWADTCKQMIKVLAPIANMKPVSEAHQ